MRIIKIFMVSLVALAVIFPQIASASETVDNNADIKNTISKFISFLSPEIAFADETPIVEKEEVEKLDQEKEKKTEEEIKNEAILSKWKNKQSDKWKNLPKGQFVVNASAYTASADECGNSKGITASGIKVKENRTIACPQSFPFGVKIKIEGMGTYICEDRGGAIKGNKIDIYMLTKKEAFKFGRQNRVAEIVEG